MSSVYGGRLVACIAPRPRRQTTTLLFGVTPAENVSMLLSLVHVAALVLPPGEGALGESSRGGSRGWQLGELGDGGSVNWATVKTKGKPVCQI